MKYKLRAYQEEAVNASLEKFNNYFRPFIVQMSTGCLAKDTPILLSNGETKQVHQLKKGDALLSYDQYSKKNVINYVEDVIRTSHKPKPMIELEYDTEKITTTYDHPFYNGSRFYPLFELIWGKMETSQREKIKLLCKQYGENINHQEKRRLSSCCNETCTRCKRILQDCNEWKDNKSTQNSSRELAGEPIKTTSCKPYKWRQRRQQSRKLRMVYSEIQRIYWDYYRKNKKTSTPKRKTSISKSKRLSFSICRKKFKTHKPIRKDKTLRQITKEIPLHIKSNNNVLGKQFKIKIKEAEPYYSICMRESPYTYYIGKRNNFLTHNSGKSLVISEICHKLDTNVLILCPNKEILEQNYSKLLSYGISDIGIYSASMNTKEIGKYTYATIGSIYKNPELFKHFRHIIIDEVHNVNMSKRNSMYFKFFDAVENKYPRIEKGEDLNEHATKSFLHSKKYGLKIMGLTATPFRVATKYRYKSNWLETYLVAQLLENMTDGFWDKVIYKKEIKDLQAENYLSPLKYYATKTDWSDLEINTTGLDFTTKSLVRNGERVGTRFMESLKHIDKVNKRHLIFCSSISQTHRLKREMEKEGYSVDRVDGTMGKKEREQILEDFASGKIKHLLNVGVLTTGYDLPEIDAISLLRPTFSVSLYIQMIGRGLRIAEGKTHCNIYDFSGTIFRFGKVENILLTNYFGKNELVGDYGKITEIELRKFKYPVKKRV